MVDSINRLSLRYISGVRTLRDLIVMILTIAAIIAVLTALFVLVLGALFPDDVCDKMILFGGVCRNNTTVLIAIALMALAFHLTIIFNALRLRNGDAHR